MNVAVVEPGSIGGGATAAGMGHIVVMDDSAAQFALTHYSQLLWQQLARELPEYAEYETRGTLWIAAGAEQMDKLRRKCELYRGLGVAAEILDSNELTAAEPNLRKGLAGALRVIGDGVLYAPGASRYLLERALLAKAALYRDRVVHLGSEIVLLAGGAELHAPRIINATGDWAPELTAGLPIKKRKGHLVITDRYPGMLRHQVVELAYLDAAHASALDSVAFNVQPRSTGQILIGSSRQYENDVNEPGEVESAILSRMLQHALEYMPCLASVSIIRAWTGFRAATPDMLPFIGPSVEDTSVFLATGHEGLGVTTSLATARLLADFFQGRQSAIPIEPYLPARMRGMQNA
jgi:glycine/D-amino acid oxidase-like deaminating enzyme